MKMTLQVGRIAGIPVGLNYSWFAIFALVTFTLGQHVFPALYPDWSTAVNWAVGVATSILFFLCLLAHELAHSVVALRKGVPVKSITLFIFGAAARIAREPPGPGAEFLMAAAGPLSSVLLAGLFALVWVATRSSILPLAAIGYYLAWINLAVAAFNMLPGFPLDGGRVLRSIVWRRSGNYRKATRICSLIGQGLGYLLIAGGIALGALYYWVSGIWLVFIGAFLAIAASASYRQAMLRESIKGVTAASLMAGDCQTVPGELTVQTLVEGHTSPRDRRCLLVGEPGSITGVVTDIDIRRVPKRRRSTTRVSEAMTPVGRIAAVQPGDDGSTVAERMTESVAGVLLVVSDGTVLGVIERERLVELGRSLVARGA